MNRLIIYAIENTVNGKCYVGQTVQGIATRWRKHRHEAKKKRTRISKAIRKYGVSAFRIFALSDAKTKEQLNSLEKLYIILFRSSDERFGYNITEGGESVRISSAGIAKMKATLTGRKLSEEHRRNIAESVRRRWKNKEYKTETGSAISRSLTGKPLSEQHKQILSRAKKGKPWSPARRACVN